MRMETKLSSLLFGEIAIVTIPCLVYIAIVWGVLITDNFKKQK